MSDAQIEALNDALTFTVISEKEGTKQTVTLGQMEKQPDGSYQYVMEGASATIAFHNAYTKAVGSLIIEKEVSK